MFWFEIWEDIEVICHWHSIKLCYPWKKEILLENDLKKGWASRFLPVCLFSLIRCWLPGRNKGLNLKYREIWANRANYVMQPQNKFFSKYWVLSYFKVFIWRFHSCLLYILQAFHWFECNACHDWIFAFLSNNFNKNGHIPHYLVFWNLPLPSNS